MTDPATGVRVTGYVNGHIVFSEKIPWDASMDRAVAASHIGQVLEYVKSPDDVFLIDLHFLDDDTHCRVGTDRAAMVDPVPLAEGSVISEDHGGWKVE